MRSCISLYSYWKLVSEQKTDHYQVIDTIKDLGIDAVELQIFEKSLPEGETMATYAGKLHAYATHKGLEVPMFTVSSALYCAEPEKELDRLMTMVDIAGELGIPFMRFDITFKFLGNEASKSPKKIIEAASPYIRRLADYAKEKGVVICSENHGRVLQDSYRIEELMYAVDHENYRSSAIWATSAVRLTRIAQKPYPSFFPISASSTPRTHL